MTSLHRDPKLRASDADRDHVAEQLREHCATGRLTMDEFGERLERCYAAQTYGDLEALIEDLPAANPYGDLPVPVTADHQYLSRVPYGSVRDDGHGGWGTWAAWSAWSSVSVICWAIWLATLLSGGGPAGVWPVWVTVPWGGVLLAQELGGARRSSRPALPPPHRPPGLPGESGKPGDRPPGP
ncbi:MAG: hypothetical protein QOE76_4074 [Frankiales bacterium]|jgi:hypothetical protein|nr:hypothetical protein [Frankiales bacterium]MDX6246351.1 hypothetical protein [Frankiales bacterium]